LAVDFDRAAFEDHRHVEAVQAASLANRAREREIGREKILFSPAVEAKADGCHFSRFARRKNRGRVAKPDVAVRDAMKAGREAAERFGGGALGLVTGDEHFEKLRIGA